MSPYTSARRPRNSRFPRQNTPVLSINNPVFLLYIRQFSDVLFGNNNNVVSSSAQNGDSVQRNNSFRLSTTVPTTISSSQPQPRAENRSSFPNSVKVTYGDRSIQMNKLDLNEDDLRALFPEFPPNVAMTLKGDNGNVVAISRYIHTTVYTSRTLNLVAGGQLSESRSYSGTSINRAYPYEPGQPRNMFRIGDEDNHSQRPRSPIRSHEVRIGTGIGRSTSSRNRLSENDYIKVQLGYIVGRRSSTVVKPDESGVMKNVSIKRQNFTFDGLVNAVCDAFEIPPERRHKYQLTNRQGETYTEDDRTRSFDFWKDKGKSNAKTFLTFRRTRSRGLQRRRWGLFSGNSDSGSDTDPDYEGSLRRRSNVTNVLAEAMVPPVLRRRSLEIVEETSGESTAPSPIELARRLRARADATRRSIVGPALTSNPNAGAEVERLETEYATLATTENADGGEETNEISYEGDATLAAIVTTVTCTICTNVAENPQECPKCRKLIGGRACVLKWFITKMRDGGRKSCPLCKIQVDDTITSRCLTDLIDNLKKGKPGLRCCRTGTIPEPNTPDTPDTDESGDTMQIESE